MKIDIMTLFDGYMDYILSESIIGRARKAGYIDIACHNIRNHTHDRHSTVDDTPYGGGRGMLMMAAPVYECWQDIVKEAPEKPHTVYMSPKGQLLTQKTAARLASYDRLVILCGHYEGIDQRALDLIVDEELSIGDYVLTGGELPAAVAVDCICRMVPGVLDCDERFEQESHYDGLLEYPHYTRPASFEGLDVPDVLLNGNHSQIEQWRRRRSLDITRKNRPDMLVRASLTRADLDYLENGVDDGD